MPFIDDTTAARTYPNKNQRAPTKKITLTVAAHALHKAIIYSN